VGSTGRQRCKKDLCRQRVVLAPRTPGIKHRSWSGNYSKQLQHHLLLDVKDAIQAKQITCAVCVYKALFRNKTEPFCMRRGAKIRSTHGEKVQNAILGRFRA